MNQAVLEYTYLVDFLADFLGENAEIVLHDFSDLEHSIVKIRNGHISRRSVGDPATDFVIRSLRNLKPNTYYKCNYTGLLNNFTRLKCASYYIYDKNDNTKVVGMLCINLNVDEYYKFRQYMDRMLEVEGDDTKENFGKSIQEMIKESLEKAINAYNCLVDELTYEQKKQIVKQINNDGIFLLKGAISQVADFLKISEPTIYRYINLNKN